MKTLRRAFSMLVYNARHAARSLARTPVFTFVMELSLGLGVALWTVARTGIDAQDNVTIANAAHIYHLEIARDMAAPLPTGTRPPGHFWNHVVTFMLTYRDTRALAEASGRPHTISFYSQLLAGPEGGESSNLRVRFTTAPLFSMFERRLVAGAVWTDSEDADGAQVCVLTQELAAKWFGSDAKALGGNVRIGAETFRVSGVVVDERTERRLYDFTAYPDIDGIYVPLAALPVLRARPVTYYPWGGSTESFDAFLAGEAGYLQAFVELPDEDARRAYMSLLDDYVAAQRATDRAPRLSHGDLRPLVGWAGMLTATPFKLFQLFGAIAFAACVFNLVRLLVAKFSARAGEVAIRRALGAPRRAIFLQHLLEAELVSCGGTVLGLLLAAAGIAMLNAVLPDRPVDFSLDMRRVLLASLAAVVAGLAAGIYPAWRICNTQPATVLRRQ